MSNKTISSKVKGYERSNYRDHGPDFLDGEDMEDPSTKLYGLQNQVPRLPVPDLNETFELFLNSVKPHVTQDEFKETMRKVYDFKNNGLAEKCQDRLLALKEVGWGLWNYLVLYTQSEFENNTVLNIIFLNIIILYMYVNRKERTVLGLMLCGMNMLILDTVGQLFGT